MDEERYRYRWFSEIPERLYRIREPSQNEERIGKIRQLLTGRTDLSFIFYFNHISYNDPLLAAYIVEKIDPKHSRYLLAPVSLSHLENPVFRLLNNIARKSGVNTVGIVQEYQVEQRYSQEIANQTYRRWLSSLNEAGRPVGCLISPEGHRSETGELGEGRMGIVKTGSKLAPVVYIPMAIVYRGQYNRNGFNFGREVELIIGKTSIQEKPRPGVSLDELMGNLANALPLEMRGKWK